MASGDVVGIITHVGFPAGTTTATPDIIVGASTPTEAFVVYDFDDTTNEHLDFHGSLHGYDNSSGLTVLIRYVAADTATSVNWEAGFRAIPDDTEALGTAHTYINNTVTDTVPGVIGEVGYASIAFTHGADMDSLANTESFVLRIERDATDSLAGDASLLDVIITET